MRVSMSRNRQVDPVCEFLSDAPFFGLILCKGFKLANCACASGWRCLMNLDLLAVQVVYSLFRVVDFVPAGKILVHREVEVNAVYQRFLTSWQRAIPQDF